MDANIYKEKARENLKIAELAFGESCFNASVSCAYYSMLQTAIAILIEHGVMAEKKRVSHEWVQANFSTQIVGQKKLVKSKFRSFLHTVHELRNKADYSRQLTSKKVARRTLNKAKEFIENLKD